MYKINDRYYLDSDANNLILLERKIHGENSGQKGEEYYITIGYFSTLDTLYKRIVEKEIKDDLGVIQNMEKIVELIKELEKSIKEYLKRN